MKENKHLDIDPYGEEIWDANEEVRRKRKSRTQDLYYDIMPPLIGFITFGLIVFVLIYATS